MVIRNWYKRNLSSAKKIQVESLVASGERCSEAYVQMRLKSDEGKTLLINMNPIEAHDLAVLLIAHSNRRIKKDDY
jgi:hypothetical protein|tara:strand:+ start:312 stop:539 length:228 start_codon:yes stop_codon:yes gene_type:complete